MNLRQAFTVAAVGLSLGVTSVAFAQDEAPMAETSPISISADAAFVLPLGDWADFSGPGIGAIARVGFQLQPQLQLTGRLGYIFHLPKDQGGVDLSTAELLVLGGARYNFGPASVDVATGLNLWSLKASGGGLDGSETETRIPLMVGVSVPVSMVEIGADLLIPNLLLTEDGEDIQMGIMATVGYRFL